MKVRCVLRQLSKWIFVACGFWLMAPGGYFILARPPLLPEDLRYLGSNTSQVETLLPHLASWLRNVFTVMGGFIAGGGVLTVFVSVHAVPDRLQGTATVLGCAGFLTVATMSGTNFMLDSDFKWSLLVPTVAWLLAFVTYGVGRTTEDALVPRTHAHSSK
jgi:hypothetical protein